MSLGLIRNNKHDDEKTMKWKIFFHLNNENNDANDAEKAYLNNKYYCLDIVSSQIKLQSWSQML